MRVFPSSRCLQGRDCSRLVSGLLSSWLEATATTCRRLLFSAKMGNEDVEQESNVDIGSTHGQCVPRSSSTQEAQSSTYPPGYLMHVIMPCICYLLCPIWTFCCCFSLPALSYRIDSRTSTILSPISVVDLSPPRSLVLKSNPPTSFSSSTLRTAASMASASLAHPRE